VQLIDYLLQEEYYGRKQRNNISSDNLAKRDERLTLISDNIKEMGTEIGLSAEVITWGENANGEMMVNG